MKKAVSLFLALLLTFTLCGAGVYAEDDMGGEVGSSTQHELTGGVVTGFAYDRLFAGLTLESYEKGKLEDLYFLIDTINKALDCTVLLPDGQKISALCTATWNTDTLTLDVAGIYTVTATLSPPDGCTFGDGVRREIVVPVQIVDPDGAAVLIISIDEWVPNGFAIAVPVHDPIETVANHPDLDDLRISGTDENGATQDSTVEWNFSAVDMNTPSLYQVSGTLLPPPGLVFAPELALPEPVLTVSVQTPGSPDINCYSRGRSALVFPWLLSEEQKGQLDQFQVWLAVDGVWSKLESGHGLTSDYLQISLTILSTDHTYGLQVDYPGGQTGILSFTYDGSKLDSDYSEGDRDGGDSDGNDSSDNTQPPPKPEDGDTGSSGNEDGGSTQPPPKPEDGDTGSSGNEDGGSTQPPPKPEPSPEPSPTPTPEPSPSPEPIPPSTTQSEDPTFVEEITDTSTTISGLRLRLMREQGALIQFAKQEVNVILSDKAIDSLELSDDSVFFIEIKRESKSKNSFSLAVSVDAVSITELVGTEITTAYIPSGQSSALTLQHDTLGTKTTGNYEPQQQLATFVVDATGQYTILEEAVPAAISGDTVQPEQTGSSLIPIGLAVGSLLLLCGGAVLLKRRAAK